MMKKAFFIGLMGIAVLSPLFCSANLSSQPDWKEAKSCIHLSNQLKKLISNPDFDPTITSFPKVEDPLIDEGQSTFSSSTFFTDYNKKKQQLTIIKGPKDAKNTLINFNKAKKIAKFQLPNDFQELEILFFKEEMLILSANRFPKWENPETIVLFYEIKNDKLSPIHFFRQSGKKIKRELINEKLYLISETPFSKEQAQSLIKKDGDLPTLFPKTSEGLSYGLKFADEHQARCKDFKYLFSAQTKMPQMWSIIVSDLNNLQAAKERFYLLGNFTNFQFSKDFLYASSERWPEQSLAQRFALEPKINYQKSELLSGKSLSNSILSEKTKSAFITERKSWKLKSYILTPFDERFIAQTSVELFSGNESYSSAQLINKDIVLGNEKEIALVGHHWDQWDFQSTKATLISRESQTFFFDFSLTQLLKIYQEEQKIKISLLPKDQKKEKTDEIIILKLENSSLFWIPAWNKDKNLIFLPIKSPSLQWKPFKWIRGFAISAEGRQKEIFARNYPNAKQAFKSIMQLPYFSYTINNEVIDLFLPEQGKTMKILKVN